MDQSLIFMKVLSKTDVEHRMAIPMESFAVFGIPQGKHSQNFDFLDMISTGRSWSFRCSKRTNNSHPKPVLTSDWIKYVKEKCLKEGDQVNFFYVKKDGEERLQFGVQALKKSRLTGTDFWTPV
ncbi:AP2/ERF and B3 domain-containing protein [Salix suchowensis]|nr:AP2/ERF and B3 domain-containing protein [Salix suchowensis]